MKRIASAKTKTQLNNNDLIFSTNHFRFLISLLVLPFPLRGAENDGTGFLCNGTCSEAKFPFIRYSGTNDGYAQSELPEVNGSDISGKFPFVRVSEVEVVSKAEVRPIDDTGKFPFLRVREYEEVTLEGGTAATKETGTPAVYNISIKHSPNRQKMFFRTRYTVTSTSVNTSVRKRISMLGLFDLSVRKSGSRARHKDSYEERVDGRSELFAAQLAVSHVNTRHAMADGHVLELLTNDTRCDPGVAVDTLFHAIFSRDTRVPILLGTACSEATASLANIVPYWNILQISFGATSPVLSDRKEFPLFYRVVAAEMSHNAARLAFIKHFGWHTVSAISQNQKEYTLAVNHLINKLEESNITCKGTVTIGENDFQDQLQLLKDTDARIILASFSRDIAPRIFCKVHELHMFGADYAWILQGRPQDYEGSWWKNQTQCLPEYLKLVAQGLIFVSNYYGALTSTYSGYMDSELREELAKNSLPLSRFARESYDAVWVAAIALNESIQYWREYTPEVSIDDFDYHRFDMSKRMFQSVAQLNFTGVSGPLSFEGADRVGTSVFYQIQGEVLVMVALYQPWLGKLHLGCNSCSQIIWAAGQVPVSQRFFRKRIETIASEAFISVACFTILAVLMAILFLAFNLYYRKLKYIKLSSPRLNNMAVVGCMAVYAGVLLLGLDHATFPYIDYFPLICTAKVYFFAAGFSLAFGSIFAKTYRIHKIFIRSQGGFVKKKFLQDTQLILLVCVLLLVDGLMLTLWVVVDPMERQLHNLTIEYSTTDRTVVYQPQVEICSCQHLHSWLCALYAYKGLQLVMGVYMAWETRHVKISALNDSQYIGMSVYGVVITSCIVVVLANYVSERPTVAYISISTMILSTTTATLGLLFLPKVLTVYSRSDNTDPVMQSMGLKLESNTRRFVTDDAREKLYRLEVQNRVFKREALALRTEIKRLEKQLQQSISLTNSASSIESATCNKTSEYLDSGKKSPAKSRKYSESSTGNAPSRFPRCSWPTDIHAIFKHQPIRPDSVMDSTDIGAETGADSESRLTARVVERIRNMISTKREAKKEPISMIVIGEEERKRKFSLTMCLQGGEMKSYKSSSKEIVISVHTSNEDLHDKYYRTKVNQTETSKWRRRRLIHQKSQPSLPLSERRKDSPRFPHRIAPTNSLTDLAAKGEGLREMSRSLDVLHYSTESALSPGTLTD